MWESALKFFIVIQKMEAWLAKHKKISSKTVTSIAHGCFWRTILDDNLLRMGVGCQCSWSAGEAEGPIV